MAQAATAADDRDVQLRLAKEREAAAWDLYYSKRITILDLRSHSYVARGKFYLDLQAIDTSFYREQAMRRDQRSAVDRALNMRANAQAADREARKRQRTLELNAYSQTLQSLEEECASLQRQLDTAQYRHAAKLAALATSAEAARAPRAPALWPTAVRRRLV